MEGLWQQYRDAEARRVRHQAVAALDVLIARVLEQPEHEWRAWARAVAAAVSDKKDDVPIRMPLFRRVLLPALIDGINREEPGCARWLAHLESLLMRCDLEGLPENLRTADGLLQEALRVDPSDAVSRRRLVESWASYLDYTLHELPSGVLYGHDGATPEQCDELGALLETFRGHVAALHEEDRFADLMAECDLHYRAYAVYLRTRRSGESYGQFLEVSGGIDEPRRAVLRALRRLLWRIGSANDAQDHGSGAEAERMRSDSCEGVRGLLADHPFLAELFPKLQRELDTGHILGFGWSQLSDRLDAYLTQSEAGKPRATGRVRRPHRRP